MLPSNTGIKRLLSEKNIHLVFDLSLWLKGALALLEIAGGILAYFVTQQFVINAAAIVTQGELAEDPHDLIATYLLHTAQGFSVSVISYFDGLASRLFDGLPNCLPETL